MKHWFLTDIWPHLDFPSIRVFGAVTFLGIVTRITSNEVTLFFTVGVGATAMIFNIVKTKIMIDKEKERKRLGREPDEDD